MPSIKFSHAYRKLLCDAADKNWKTPGYLGDKAMLLQIFRSDFADLTAEFIAYDTDKGVYKLPPTGPCMVLVFQKRTVVPNLFTTVRPYTPEKLEYYSKMIGQVVDLQVTL